MRKKEVNGLKKKKNFIEKMNSLDKSEANYYESLIFALIVTPLSLLLAFIGNKIAISLIFKDGITNYLDNIVKTLSSKIAFPVAALMVILIVILEFYVVMEKKPSIKKYLFTSLIGISLSFVVCISLFAIDYIEEKQELFVSGVILENTTVDSIEAMNDREVDGFLFQKNERRFVIESGKKNTIIAVSKKINKDGSFDFETFEMNDETKTVRLNGWDYTIER